MKVLKVNQQQKITAGVWGNCTPTPKDKNGPIIVAPQPFPTPILAIM